jgi:hypothetical protein
MLVGLGSVLLALLATAAMIEPDARGYGTHQQLGFPPCTFQQLFDQRCPACGMTTSWANLVRGRLWRALQANLGGTLLAIVSAIAGPWSLISGIRGRWLVMPPSDYLTVGVCVLVVVVTMVDWASRYFLAVGS